MLHLYNIYQSEYKYAYICVDTVNGLAVVSNRYTTRGGFI